MPTWGVLLAADLHFALNYTSGQPNKGFKITKYRLWRVSSGDNGYEYKTYDPRNGQSTYADDPNGAPGIDATSRWTSPTFYYPKAGMIRVCFDNFNVEQGYDYVHIEDGTGQVVEVLTGVLGSFCSAWVQGQKLKVNLLTDYSINYYGFDIVGIEVMRGSEVQARFPGQWYEKSTEVRDANKNLLSAGLHYNWHRYYDPNIGRYITPDPLGLAAGMNIYGYVGGNPASYVDPDGLKPTTKTEKFLTAAAAAGDAFTLGATAYIRKKLGYGKMIDQNSTSYKVGEFIGSITPSGRARGASRMALRRLKKLAGKFKKKCQKKKRTTHADDKPRRPERPGKQPPKEACIRIGIKVIGKNVVCSYQCTRTGFFNIFRNLRAWCPPIFYR